LLVIFGARDSRFLLSVNVAFGCGLQRRLVREGILEYFIEGLSFIRKTLKRFVAFVGVGGFLALDCVFTVLIFSIKDVGGHRLKVRSSRLLL
jgi:hypothetical protein